MRYLLPGLLVLTLPGAAAAQGKAVVLDNFEAGVQAWETNDHRADETGGRASYAAIRPARGHASGAVGEGVALISFEPAARGWASVTLPVDGRLWQRDGCERISMWLRGVGPDGSVEVTLRGLYDNPETGRRDLDVAFSRGVRVTEGWSLLLLEFSSFRTRAGRAMAKADVEHVHQFQFVQAPEIRRLAFEVDDLLAETSDYPHEAPTPPPPAGADVVEVDFGPLAPRPPAQAGQRIRALAQIGANLPSGVPPEIAGAVGQRLRQLTPCVARVKLSDFYRARDGLLDEPRLSGMVEWILDSGARPMVCLDRPTEGSADIFAFARLCTQATRACAAVAPSAYYEVFDEPLYRGNYNTIRDATAAYEIVADAVKRADAKAVVGGIGLAAPWRDNVTYFVQHASRLDFLSLHFYGAHSASITDARLVQAALDGSASDLPDQLPLAELPQLISTLRGRPLDVFLTEVWMNSVQDQAGQSADPRAQAPLGAAWLAAFVASVARHVDKVLPRQLYGDGWGLAGDDGEPLPPYWAAWLLSTYAPRGSGFAGISRSDPALHVYAARTATACNVVVIALEPGRHRLTVAARNTGPLSQVRSRALDPERNEIAYLTRPTRSRQAISLDGPSVLVLQFIPSP